MLEIMTSILITTSSFGKHDQSLIDDLTNKGIQITANPFGRKLTEPEVTELITRHQPLGIIAGVEPLSRAVLQQAINLKIISRCGIGMDSVDLKAAKELGIKVTNTPDGPTIPVAELTVGMILALLRRIHLVDGAIRRGEWERPMGGLLYGKTVGIIGCGRIGSYVAKLLASFGCKILGCDLFCSENECYEPTEIDELLAAADIVTIHIPYSEENHHFINRDRLNIMKKGTILVNAARGGLVNEKALYEALEKGRLAGAALDSFEEEPYKGPLRNLNNVLLTSHIGSYAKEARVMMERQAAENLLRELKKLGAIK